MQLKRNPADASELPIDDLLARWTAELAALEAALGPPKAEPLVAGAEPGRPVSDAWRAEMRARDDLLFPLATEMALVYRQRLGDAERWQAQALLAGHSWVVWQWPSVIRGYFERFLRSLARHDLDVALALIALYDERATSRDFSRSAYAFYRALADHGLDPARCFRAALPLATRHGDPERGAHGLFLQYGRDDDVR